MINLGLLLSGKPVLLKEGLYFYQPTIQEIVEMSESTYWAALNIWLMNRKDFLPVETEETKKLTDYELWKKVVCEIPQFTKILRESVFILLKQQIELLKESNTIVIGEPDLGTIVNEQLYNIMKIICERLIHPLKASEDEQQYRETEGMSAREREMIRKMKQHEEQLSKMRDEESGNRPEDRLGRQILGLVSIGHYTFEQVYNMTLLQLNMLLKKYVDIESFELRSILSPYIDSNNGPENKFWLD